MCGRYIDPDLRGTEFELAEIRIDPIPRRFNIKPTQDVYVQIDRALVMARWGLIPSWHRGERKDRKPAEVEATFFCVNQRQDYAVSSQGAYM